MPTINAKTPYEQWDSLLKLFPVGWIQWGPLQPDAIQEEFAAPAAAAGHTHDDPVGGPTSLVIGGVAEAGATVPTATAEQSIAEGDYASASAQGAIVIGSSRSSGSAAAVASGQQSIAIGGEGSWVTQGAQAVSTASIAIGAGSLAGVAGADLQCLAMGTQASCLGQNSIAIGTSASVTAVSESSVAIGQAASAAIANDATVVGHAAVSQAENGSAFGHNANVNATHDRSVALGSNSASSAADQLAIDTRHIEFEQLTAAPGTPANNHLRFYVKDLAGETRLYYKSDAGTEYGPL